MVTKEKATYSFTFKASKLDKIYWKLTSNDNRQLVSSTATSSLPYSAIGLLKILYSLNIVSYRTGILINPNIVLTAGHNLYDHRTNPNDPSTKLGRALDISFYPSLSNNMSQYNECKYLSYHYPTEFESGSNEDFGIIVLKERIGDITGWIDLKLCDGNAIPQGDRYFISGYPLNKTNKANDIFYQYEAKGKILHINNTTGMVTTNIKSSYGQSGSGLCYHEPKDDKFYVVGVHVASSYSDDEFYSIMINKKRFELIEKWIQETN